MSPEQAEGREATGPIDTFRQRETTLSECPSGLFLFGGELCFRSQYDTPPVGLDAYIVRTGEFFWGGAKTAEERRALRVTPLAAEVKGPKKDRLPRVGEPFLCGSPNRLPGQPRENYWRQHANGDRVCSYCGSLHDDDVTEILTAYAAGDEGVHFDPSTKNYKLYVKRAGVKNASDGGIKFYSWHVPQGLTEEQLAVRRARWDAVMLRWRMKAGYPEPGLPEPPPEAAA